MTILTKAGKDYKCNACKLAVISKGDKHMSETDLIKQLEDTGRAQR